MKRTITILLLSLLAIYCNAQLVRQPITNYTPRDYGLDVPTYSYSLAEGDNGIIYVGTAFGVLQFDGVSWRFIPVRVGANVTSIAVHKGIVYVGCHTDFGYLSPNETGMFQFKSLAVNLNETDKNFSAIWKTLVLNDTIIFQAEERMFLFHNDSLTVIKPKESFHLAFVENGKLFVREREQGLLAFDGKKFNELLWGDTFQKHGVFSILPYGDNQRLICTRDIGFWVQAENKVSKLELGDELEEKLSRADLLGGIRLKDGNYAFNTLKEGIFILDSTLALIANYSINSGMLSSEVWDLIQDRYGNLWSATQRGASRLQYTSPFSIFGQSVGLFGSVNASTKFNGSYLIGTNEGLFVSNVQGQKVFESVPSVQGSVWAIEKSPQGLWIATENGLWLFNGKTYKQINRNKISGLRFIPESNWIIAAGVNGFNIFDASSKALLLALPNVKAESYGLAYQYNKPEGYYEIWMGSKTSGVWQFKIQNDLTASYDFYSLEDGLPPDWVCAYQAGHEIVFATSNGMLRFISPQELHSLLNDDSMDIENLRGYFDLVDFPKYSNSRAITAFYYNEDMSFVGLDYHVNSVSMNDSIPNDFHFKTLELGRLNVINRVDDEILVGGDNGLAIVTNIDFSRRDIKVPNLVIRRISIGGDSTVWHGDIKPNQKAFVIPYELNSVQVDLASCYFDNGTTALYTWRYKGDEESIYRWTSQSSIPFSNLREGDYDVVFMAKNANDIISEEFTISLKVLPPWYRNWWAYSLYAVLSILMVYLIIQYNIRRLKEQNKKLEEIVKARTKEVVDQKNHIEHILQDIQASINYAQRIQQALLPARELLKEYFPKHFIIFHPRDVVSGDFYWATKIDKWVVVTVADCTGHGVPGAFMSMLGVSFLNEIVRRKEVVSASMILNHLRKAVIEALKQTGKQNEQKDGMDMSLAVINIENKTCMWAGANNPLYVVRNGRPNDNFFDDSCGKCKIIDFENNHIIEIKGDKMPVAIHTIMEDYRNHQFQLQNGDRLFMFTDGFSDQFGGPDFKKFMAKNFKQLIATTAKLPIIQQGLEIDKAFKLWAGYNVTEYDQIDDVTVMGIEI